MQVGDNGRLRAVLESGHVGGKEARDIGLPQPEAYKGKRTREADPGFFNPLTHSYSTNSSPRDTMRASGRNPGVLRNIGLSPRLNPVTQELDPINSTAASLRVYDKRVLHPNDLHVVPRPPILMHGFHAAEGAFRSPRQRIFA